MPLLSGIVRHIRLVVSSTVGALIFIIPVAPGLAAGPGAGLHRALPVRPPASARIAQGTELLTTTCVAAGSCAAGGNFGGAGRPLEPMVATQSHGRWSRGTPLLLPANAAAQPYAQVSGLACHSTGNCVAVGDYQYGRSGSLQAFIAIESRGRWARAFTLRLPANAASPSSAQLEAVTCISNGSCDAVGTYQDPAGNAQTMVVAKPPSGPWGQATEIASPPNAAANPDALMTGIACTAPGSCVMAGNYSVSAAQFAAMGAVEVRGEPMPRRRPVPRLGHAEPCDGGDRVEGPVRPGGADHSGAAGQQPGAEHLSPGCVLPAFRPLPRGRRRAELRGSLGGHVHDQVGRALAGHLPRAAARRHVGAAATVRAVLGIVPRLVPLRRCRVLPRPARRHPRRGDRRALMPLTSPRRSGPGSARHRRCRGARRFRAAAAAGRWATPG